MKMLQPYFLQRAKFSYFSFKRYYRGNNDKITQGSGGINFFRGESTVPSPYTNGENCPAGYAFKPKYPGLIVHTINIVSTNSRGSYKPVDYTFKGFPQNFIENGSYETNFIIQSADSWFNKPEYYEIAGMTINISTSGPDTVSYIRLKFVDLFKSRPINIFVNDPLFTNEENVRFFCESLPSNNGNRDLSIHFSVNFNESLENLAKDILLPKGWIVNGESSAIAEPTATEQPGAMEEPTATEQPGAMEEPTATEQPSAIEEPTATEQPGAMEEPTATEQPSAMEEPTATEQPGAMEELTATEQPSAMEEPIATEQPG